MASYRAAPPPRSLTGLAEAFLSERCVVIEYVDRNGPPRPSFRLADPRPYVEEIELRRAEL